MRRAGLTALIFDVDGTLADTEEAHRQAFNAAFRAHGLDVEWSVELYAELLAVTGGKERLRHYLGKSEGVAEIHATKTRLYGELVRSGQVGVRPGVFRLLDEARRSGLRLAVASTTSPENVGELLATALGADGHGWFDVIATGDAVAHKKPAPDIYRLALARLEIAAERAAAFEDSAIGVRSAKAARLFTVATPTGWTRGQDFTAADLILPSLDDLSLEQLVALHADAQERAHAQAD